MIGLVNFVSHVTVNSISHVTGHAAKTRAIPIRLKVQAWMFTIKCNISTVGVYRLEKFICRTKSEYLTPINSFSLSPMLRGGENLKIQLTACLNEFMSGHKVK